MFYYQSLRTCAYFVIFLAVVSILLVYFSSSSIPDIKDVSVSGLLYLTANISRLKPPYVLRTLLEENASHSGGWKVNMNTNSSVLVALLYRINRKPHTGPRLHSVEDPLTGDKCEFTYDKTRWDESHVVFFPANIMAKARKIPEYRPKGQRWVYCTGESFYYVKPSLRYRHAFNHTMTYHHHADIDFNKGRCLPHEDANISMPSLSNKTMMVAWVTSHCKTQSKRETFVQKLSKYVKVDIYGACGKLKCPKKTGCQNTLEKYKFYISMENSICNDYVTEKSWNSLTWGAVPLVAGAGSQAYRSVLPPNSYIDLEHFSSAKAVGQFLQILDKNDTLYKEYFDWRKHYSCGYTPVKTMSLRACRYLHQTKADGPHQVDIKAFHSDKRAACHSPSDVSWLK